MSNRPQGAAAPTYLRSAIIITGLIVVLAGLSMFAGAGFLSAGDSLGFILGDPQLRADAGIRTVLLELRLPRMVVAILVGAVLGLAGSLLQTITRNSLAEPGLLGVNAGAALAVVAGITWAGADTGYGYLLWAFMGALLTNFLIIAIAHLKAGAMTPLKLILAGVAIQATLQGTTAFILMKNQLSFDQYRYWVLGSLSGVSLDLALDIIPAVIVAIIIVILVARPLSALLLGDEIAVGLGHRPGIIRIIVAFSVTLCAGSAVALTGPVSFMGLMAPYFARSISGNARLIPLMIFSALFGALILLAADILARLVTQPFETPVSVIVALLGAPVLIWIVRTGRVTTGTVS